MDVNSSSTSLGKNQRFVLVLFGLGIAVLLLFLRGEVSPGTPLDQLARKSIAPEAALSNGKPTLLEFYADWCEVCREMAPSMLELESKIGDQIDFVLLNVDNDSWQDLIYLYGVNGIPQINLFDRNGKSVGKSIGLRSQLELEELANYILTGEEIPRIPGENLMRKSSNYMSPKGLDLKSPSISPRSHS